MSTSLPTLTPLASAIAQAEGFGASPNNIPTLSNNPGDLELGDVGYGTASAAGGNQITVFGSLESGAQALENQVSKIFDGTSSNYTPDMTLAQFGATYSGGNTSYGDTLASILGVSPSTTLWQAQNTSTPNTAPSGNSSNSIGFLDSILNQLTGNKEASQSPNILSRSIILILGIILFAAGLFAFKTTTTVIQSTASGIRSTPKHIANARAIGGAIANRTGETLATL